MSRDRYRIGDPLAAHFFTATIVAWLPLFTRPEAANIVLESWRYLQRERQFKLLGYVILENHLHLIASAPELPKAMKERIGGLLGIHVYQSSHSARRLMPLSDANKERIPNAVLHPVARTHPENGRTLCGKPGGVPDAGFAQCVRCEQILAQVDTRLVHR